MWYALSKENIQELNISAGLRFKAPKNDILLHMTNETFIKKTY